MGGEALQAITKAHMLRNNHKEALITAKEALAVCNTNDDKSGQASILRSMADSNSHVARGGAEGGKEALEYGKKALVLCREAKDGKGEGEALQAITKAHMLRNNHLWA